MSRWSFPSAVASAHASALEPGVGVWEPVAPGPEAFPGFGVSPGPEVLSEPEVPQPEPPQPNASASATAGIVLGIMTGYPAPPARATHLGACGRVLTCAKRCPAR